LYRIKIFVFESLRGNVEDVFMRLATPDILVHTGSSFASAAAAVATSSQIYLYSEPKEGGIASPAYRVYFLEGPNCFYWQHNGSLTANQASKLSLQMTYAIHHLSDI
jgi:hypothetical protein